MRKYMNLMKSLKLCIKTTINEKNNKLKSLIISYISNVRMKDKLRKDFLNCCYIEICSNYSSPT